MLIRTILEESVIITQNNVLHPNLLELTKRNTMINGIESHWEFKKNHDGCTKPQSSKTWSHTQTCHLTERVWIIVFFQVYLKLQGDYLIILEIIQNCHKQSAGIYFFTFKYGMCNLLSAILTNASISTLKHGKIAWGSFHLQMIATIIN